MSLNNQDSGGNKELMKRHFDAIAGRWDKYKRRNGYYHRTIQNFIKSIVPANQKVIEIGCATGDLLNSLHPSAGAGIDFSPNMVRIAKEKHPHLDFYCMEAESLKLEMKFDYLICSNLFDYLEDIWPVLEGLKGSLNKDGKIIIITVNPVWEPIFRIGEKLNLRTPDVFRNFITNKDIMNMLELRNFEILKVGLRTFLPKYIPLFSRTLNFIVPQIPLLRQLCVMQFIVAKEKRQKQSLSCSVVIPCYNEQDNIESCLRRIPNMGKFTEAIVIDDGSSDSTASRVKGALNPDIQIRLISYKPNKGKGSAIKKGFEAAKGDVLIILDADMSVMPEELERIFVLIEDGLADFVNGTRVIYPMEQKAMPILNYIGNKLFSLILSWIMEQRVSDTLCGTKAFLKKDYDKILLEDASWGDFDLLLGSAKLCLKIREMPVHYKSRVAGKSKMKALRHGWILLKVCARGFRELKCNML